MGLDGKKHRQNAQSLVCGGGGAGKKSQFLQSPTCSGRPASYFVLDLKGELGDCGGLLERMGHEIKVVDLPDAGEKPLLPNPAACQKNDNATCGKWSPNLFRHHPKGASQNDPFWDTAASMLYMALVSISIVRRGPQNLR